MTKCRRLSTVTFTGADNETDPERLVQLGMKYHFVEFGLLSSESRAGSPRYPSAEWIAKLWRSVGKYFQNSDRVFLPRISVHLCGKHARNALAGFHPEMVGFHREMGLFPQRIQINAQPTSPYAMSFAEKLYGVEYIFQTGSDWLNPARVWANAVGVKTSLLFDASGGRGVKPNEWPKADSMLQRFHGYAGGLSPDNLRVELPRIAEAAGDRPFWIDMESGIRDSNDNFSFDKVQSVIDTTVELAGGLLG